MSPTPRSPGTWLDPDDVSGATGSPELPAGRLSPGFWPSACAAEQDISKAAVKMALAAPDGRRRFRVGKIMLVSSLFRFEPKRGTLLYFRVNKFPLGCGLRIEHQTPRINGPGVDQIDHFSPLGSGPRMPEGDSPVQLGL